MFTIISYAGITLATGMRLTSPDLPNNLEISTTVYLAEKTSKEKR